jgi:hypothetical protein
MVWWLRVFAICWALPTILSADSVRRSAFMSSIIKVECGIVKFIYSTLALQPNCNPWDLDYICITIGDGV